MAFYDAGNRTCVKVILRTAHIPQIEYKQWHKIGPLFTVSPGSCMFTQMSREKRPQTDSPLPYNCTELRTYGTAFVFNGTFVQ